MYSEESKEKKGEDNNTKEPLAGQLAWKVSTVNNGPTSSVIDDIT